jgi:hypothetical protein
MGVMTDIAMVLAQTFKVASDIVWDAVDEKLFGVRRWVIFIVAHAVFLLTGALLSLVGITFVVWGIYAVIAQSLGNGVAAVITGGVVFVIGAVFTAIIKIHGSSANSRPELRRRKKKDDDD